MKIEWWGVLVLGVLAVGLLVLVGCSGHYSREQIGFWDQCVRARAYGISGLTPYGPWNAGALWWERNVNCAGGARVEVAE